MIDNAPKESPLDSQQTIEDPPLSADLARLRRIAKERTQLRVRELVDIFGDESRMLLLIVICILNIVLSPLPGQSTVFGLLMALVAWVDMRDKALPRLPARVGDYQIPSHYIASTLDRIARGRGRIAPYLSDHQAWVCRGLAQRFSQINIMFLAFVIILPIPFGNIPQSLVIMMIAIGQAEHDGRWVIAGWVLSALHIALLWWGADWVWHHLQQAII